VITAIPIVDNPAAPFANNYMKMGNTETNYFAIGHASFKGCRRIQFRSAQRQQPDWHNATCITNLAAKTVVIDNPPAHQSARLPDGARAVALLKWTVARRPLFEVGIDSL
jgi:hypothetical protein